MSFTVESGAAKVHDTHTLCRAYISIALLDNNFDVKWVMAQVGHADSKMALDVYAQPEQRVDRSHGTSFDRLIGLAGSPRHQMKRHTLQGTRLFEIAPLVNIQFRQVRVRRGRYAIHLGGPGWAEFRVAEPFGSPWTTKPFTP